MQANNISSESTKDSSEKEKPSALCDLFCHVIFFKKLNDYSLDQAEDGNDWHKMPDVGLEWWPSTSQELRWWAWFSVKGIYFCAQNLSSSCDHALIPHILVTYGARRHPGSICTLWPFQTQPCHSSLTLPSVHQHVSIRLEDVILVLGLWFQWQSWSGLVFNGLSLDIMEKAAPSPISFHCSSKMDILILHFRTIYV